MRIVFMGTPDFSVGTLEALVAAGHEVVLAVTQPDKPRGRGKEMQLSPVKECAVKHGIPVFQPKKIREPENVEFLKNYPADISVVIAFGQILPREILEMYPYGCINVHASLLPAYRGAAPIQWAVINGESESGVTIMQMDEGLDTGDMLAKVHVPLEEKETGGSLHDKLAEAGATLCVETLDRLKKGEVTPEKQGETTTAYARMLKKEMGEIDWEKPARETERLIRGLNPWPSAYTYWNGKMMKVWDAEVLETESGEKPGNVTVVEKDSFLVQTKEGQLRILALQIPGKKRMDTGAFLRGYPVQKGLCLGRTEETGL